MGGFLLIKNEKRLDFSINKAVNVFEKKDLKLNKKIFFNEYSLYLFFKRSHELPNCYYKDDENFIISVGTLIYKETTGTDSFKKLFSDFSKGIVDFSHILGHYCIIICLNSELYIFNDYEGIYQVYSNNDKTIISNSFLSLSAGISEKTLTTQEIYEYLFYGAIYGGKTLFKQISVINCRKIFKIYPQLEIIEKQYRYSNDEKNYNFYDWVEKVSENILDYFRILKKLFKNDIIMGLSGGFDSRLLLASLLSSGITPKIYVSGEESSKDFQISKLIAEKKQLEFFNYRESLEKRYNEEEFKTFVQSRFFNFDGLGYAGLFNSIINMDIINSDKALLNLNGGAGEIYRNLWYLSGKYISIDNLLKSVYYSLNFNIGSEEFNKKRFFETLGNKIKDNLDFNENKIFIKDIQKIYPMFELRYFAGKGISILNQYSCSLLPFSETRFVNESISIPLHYKTAGIFEAALIKKINPDIAKYISIYGHNFYDKIKFTNKLYDIILIRTPFLFRPFLRKIKGYKSILKIPYYLENSYLLKIFGLNQYSINKYIRIDALTNAEILSRALTLEYFLINHY